MKPLLQKQQKGESKEAALLRLKEWNKRHGSGSNPDFFIPSSGSSYEPSKGLVALNQPIEYEKNYKL